MGLSSINLSKPQRVKLGEIKPPPPEPTPVEVKIAPLSPSWEEVAYNAILKRNPAIEELIEAFDLVSPTTGERIVRREGDPPQIPSSKLSKIAREILQGERSYSKEEIVTRLMEETKVGQTRAERGFTLMEETGIIQATVQGLYYLSGSTPF